MRPAQPARSSTSRTSRWKQMARDPDGSRRAAASSTTLGTRCRASSSAVTSPTGPAPTTTTGSISLLRVAPRAGRPGSPRPRPRVAALGGGLRPAARPFGGLGDGAVGDLPVLPAADVGALARFQALVDVEEVGDLVADALVDVAQVADLRVAHVRGRDAEDLRVGAALVEHPEHADAADGDLAAGEGGLLQQDHHVERVAVLCD